MISGIQIIKEEYIPIDDICSIIQDYLVKIHDREYYRNVVLKEPFEYLTPRLRLYFHCTICGKSSSSIKTDWNIDDKSTLVAYGIPKDYDYGRPFAICDLCATDDMMRIRPVQEITFNYLPDHKTGELIKLEKPLNLTTSGSGRYVRTDSDNIKMYLKAILSKGRKFKPPEPPKEPFCVIM